MARIRLYDTRSRSPAELAPREGRPVGIYACGPTVYGRIHVGNARPFVVFSLLKRYLEHEGHAVKLVINVTDVNDKIYTAAEPLGVPSAELAAAWRPITARTPIGSASDARTPSRWRPRPSSRSSPSSPTSSSAATRTPPAATSTSACARTRSTAR